MTFALISHYTVDPVILPCLPLGLCPHPEHCLPPANLLSLDAAPAYSLVSYQLARYGRVMMLTDTMLDSWVGTFLEFLVAGLDLLLLPIVWSCGHCSGNPNCPGWGQSLYSAQVSSVPSLVNGSLLWSSFPFHHPLWLNASMICLCTWYDGYCRKLYPQKSLSVTPEIYCC